MKYYIVIEVFDPTWPSIITSSNGYPIIFNSKEEAQKEADECQNGIVVNY